jgi:hypothetical protein
MKMQCDGDYQGMDGEESGGSLYYRACSESKSEMYIYCYSKQADGLGGGVFLSWTFFFRIARVCAEMETGAFSFVHLLTGSLVLRLAVSFEVWFKVLITYSSLAWGVVPLVLVLVCRLLTVR